MLGRFSASQRVLESETLWRPWPGDARDSWARCTLAGPLLRANQPVNPRAQTNSAGMCMRRRVLSRSARPMHCTTVARHTLTHSLAHHSTPYHLARA